MNSKLVTAFNNQLLSFIEQSTKVFPQVQGNAAIQQSISKLRVITEVSPEVPILKFKKLIEGKYDEFIKKNDDTFFEQFQVANVEAFDFFKEVYWQSKEENKKIIWKYLNQFRQLASKYKPVE